MVPVRINCTAWFTDPVTPPPCTIIHTQKHNVTHTHKFIHCSTHTHTHTVFRNASGPTFNDFHTVIYVSRSILIIHDNDNDHNSTSSNSYYIVLFVIFVFVLRVLNFIFFFSNSRIEYTYCIVTIIYIYIYFDLIPTAQEKKPPYSNCSTPCPMGYYRYPRCFYHCSSSVYYVYMVRYMSRSSVSTI